MLRQVAHRVRTGLPATTVTTAAALVFATLAAFVAALAHSEPPVVVRGAPAADRVMRYLGTYPREYVERLELRDRVRVALDEDHVSVWPTESASE